jgi:hypothetical protein
MQHFSKPVSRVEKECYNGVLIDLQQNCKLVSYSIPYMDHLGDVSADTLAAAGPFDSSTWTAEEKIDGTYCCLYYYDREWHICTRYEPDNPQMRLSFLPIMDVVREREVSNHFWKVWEEKGLVLPDTSLNRSARRASGGCNVSFTNRSSQVLCFRVDVFPPQIHRQIPC